MSIQQGLISPPLSGRTNKADQPRVGAAHKVYSAVDVFGTAPTHPTQPSQFDQRYHTIRSPVKKHSDDLSDADRAVRPPTPPMSKDVRHDEHSQEDHAGHHRTSSECEPFQVPASTSSVSSRRAPVDVLIPQPSTYSASTSKTGLMEAPHISERFGTLNRGISFKSDDEHNPFLDRRPRAPSTSSQPSKVAPSAAPAHPSHPYYDEFDSDQDAEGSIHDDDLNDATPRASSSNATTPPRTHLNSGAYRPARPLSTHIRVSNSPVTSTIPIRDTPKNPFLAGGPADNGLEGPNGRLARQRLRQMPPKEKGKIVYVFRGQKVTYADPEYDSDDDDSDLDDEQRRRNNEFNPHYHKERPPRLQPRLLFPPNVPASAYASSSVRHAGSNGTGGANGGGSFLPRAELDDGVGRVRSWSYGEERRSSSSGGGLFAAHITAKRTQEPVAPKREAFDAIDDFRGQRYVQEPVAERAAPGSSSRLQSVTHQSHGEGMSAREALLARLDRTNWSDDEDDESEQRDRRNRARGGSEGTVEGEVHSYGLARSQSKRERLSEELQSGHAEQVDGMGRPMKRSRASYAC